MNFIPSGRSTSVQTLLISMDSISDFMALIYFLRVRPLHGLHIGDQILIVLIKFNRITISDQKTIVSVRLMQYSTESPYWCLYWLQI